MTTVYLPENTPMRKVNAVRELCNAKAYFDPNWAGCDFELATHGHECASIDTSDEISGSALLSEINTVLFEEGAQ